MYLTDLTTNVDNALIAFIYLFNIPVIKLPTVLLNTLNKDLKENTQEFKKKKKKEDAADSAAFPES